MANVEIYTKATCPYCIRAKKLLDVKNIEYQEYPVDDGGAKRDEMIERAGGKSTVPQIFIDGDHLGGCDDLMALEQKGELDAKLKG